MNLEARSCKVTATAAVPGANANCELYRLGLPCPAALAAASSRSFSIRLLVDPVLTFNAHSDALSAAAPFVVVGWPIAADGIDNFEVYPCKQLAASGRPATARKRKPSSRREDSASAAHRLPRARCRICHSLNHVTRKCKKAGNIGESIILELNRRRQHRPAKVIDVSHFVCVSHCVSFIFLIRVFFSTATVPIRAILRTAI